MRFILFLKVNLHKSAECMRGHITMTDKKPHHDELPTLQILEIRKSLSSFFSEFPMNYHNECGFVIIKSVTY